MFYQRCKMSVLTGQLGPQRLIKQTAHLLREPFSRLYMIFYISTKIVMESRVYLSPPPNCHLQIMINKIQVHGLPSVTI